MNRYRLKFEKRGRAKYISHLDLMRTFQRAFQRAGIKVKHTEGFNPHAHISIALPLPVGMESVCEILDFETLELIGGSAVSALNLVMPEGIVIRELTENIRKASEIAWLRCELTLTYDSGVPEGAVQRLNKFFTSGIVVIRKRTKRGEADFDIIPCINEVKAEQTGENEVRITATVAAQNPYLNPMLMAEAIREHIPELAPDFAICIRLELLDKDFKPF